MMKNYRKAIGFLTLSMGVIFLILSVSTQASQENSASPASLKRIGVISFRPLIPEAESGNTVFCPLCGIGSGSGKVMEGAEKIVEDIFIERLKKEKGLEIIPSEKVQSVYKRISSEKLKGNLIENLKKTGRELGADILALGYVYRYTERVGYKYSSERPASVIFEIHLVSVDGGDIIWRGFYDKTQKSLMEDVLQIGSFLKGGAKWVTVRQLTEQGMEEVFKTFPEIQQH